MHSEQRANGIPEQCDVEQHVARGSEDDCLRDFDALHSHVEAHKPRYIVFRLDEDNEYAFITYVPDMADVRQKMLYASSANTVQRQLGGRERFRHALYWNDLADVSSRGWREHLAHVQAPDPTSEAEAREAATLGGLVGAGTSGARSHLAEVGSDNSKDNDDAWRAPEDKDSVVAFVQQHQPATGRALRVSVDPTTERLCAEPHHEIESDRDFFAEGKPAYMLYPRPGGALYFVYTCPPASSVRDKMLYSFKKDIVTRLVAQHKPALQVLEASEPDDLSHHNLFATSPPKNENAPEPVVNKPRFNRPKPPGRR